MKPSHVYRILALLLPAFLFIACNNNPKEPANGPGGETEPAVILTVDEAVAEQLSAVDAENFGDRPEHYSRILADTKPFVDVFDGYPAKDVVPYLESSRPYVRTAAVESLAKKGSDARNELALGLINGSPRIQLEVLRQGFGVNPGDRDAASQLSAMLDMDGVEIFREDEAIFKPDIGADLDPNAEYPVDPLKFYLRLIQSPLEINQADAAHNIGIFGEAAAEAVQPLMEQVTSPAYVFQSEDRTVEYFQHKLEAINALGNIGESAKVAIPTLEEQLNDEHEIIRIYTLAALYKLDRSRQSNLTQLIDIVENPEGQYLIAAVNMLASIGHDAHRTIPKLMEYAGSPDDDLRQAAIVALGEVGTPETDVVNAWIQNLQSEYGNVHIQAYQYLILVSSGTWATIDMSGRLNDFIGLLDVERPISRLAICHVVYNLGGDFNLLVPVVNDLLVTDDKETVLETLKFLIYTGKAGIIPFEQKLVDLSLDEDAEIRLKAEQCLGIMHEARKFEPAEEPVTEGEE
ncbi:MAG TPA: HEAT repeat domain-containing protein [bacterium]|jgi:HEAT repeat protein